MKKALLMLTLFVSLFMSAQESLLIFDELPQQAKDFLNQNFTEPFNFAKKEFDSRHVYYEAALTDKTEITFTEAGRWEKVDGKGKKIPYSFIQMNIADYVKVKFPKEYITKIERTDMYYFAELNTGLDLKFDAQGNFIK